MGLTSCKIFLLGVLCVICSINFFPAQADPAPEEEAEARHQVNDKPAFVPVDTEEAPLLFFEAARKGRNDVIDNLLKAGSSVDITDERGYTPLILASYNEHPDTVAFLIAHGANACIEDKYGNTALMDAAYKGNVAVAQNLLKADCPVDHQNHLGQTAFMIANLFGKTKLAKLLHDKHVENLVRIDGQSYAAFKDASSP